MPKTPPRILFWLSFLVIIFIALFVRLYRLGQIPVSLYWDEVAMYVDVKSVLQSGQDMFGRPWYQVIYPSYGDFKLPVYIWSAILSAKIFGLSEWSFRLPSVLAGVGTVAVAGFLARFLFKMFWPELASQERKGFLKALNMADLFQLITMLLLTFTPWSIMFSRTGFEGHFAQFWLALSILVIFWSRKKSSLILLSPFFGAIATYAYFSVRFVWPVVFVAAVILVHFGSPSKISKNLKGVIKKIALVGVIPFILYGLLLLPMLKSPLYQDANRFRLGTDSILNKEYVVQSNIYRQMAGNSRWDRIIFNSKWLMIRELLKNYAANTSPNFMFVTGDPNLRHGTSQDGLFLLMMLPFFGYGFLRLFNKNKMVLVFLVIWWLVALLPASVPENVPHALRSLNALVPLSLIIAFGLTDAILSWLKMKRVLFFMSCGVLFLVFSFSVGRFLYFYFNFYPQLSAHDWQDGYKQLAESIYQQKTDHQPVIIVPFDDRFYLWLMAYGPYSAKDFHSWQSQKYQFMTFGQQPITFENIDDQTILGKQKKVMVVGRFEQVTEELAKMKLKPKSINEVDGISSQEKFLIAKFE